MILSPGEKIKKIRKNLNVTQSELAKGIISVSMLSSIENNKYSLNEETAIKLCKRLNYFIKNKSIKLEYNKILIPIQVLITKKVNLIISNLKYINQSHLKNIKLLFIKSQDSYQKVRLYTILGIYFFRQLNEINISRELLEEVFDLSSKIKSNEFYFLIILFLQRVYYRVDKHLITSIYFQSKENINLIPPQAKGMLLYNFGVFFEHLNDFTKAIENYSQASKLIKTNLFEWNHVNLGFCYYKKFEYYKSIDIFINILDNTKNEFIKIKCYSNIIKNAIALKDSTIVKINIDKLEKLLNTTSSNEIYQAFFSLGEASLFLQNRYNAIQYFESEIKLGINLKNTHFFLSVYEKSIEKLITLYHPSDLKKFNILEKYILKIPYDFFSKNLYFKVLSKYSQVYNKKELNEFIKKLGSNAKN